MMEKLMREIREQYAADDTMLRGMAQSFRAGSPLTFDPDKMADLLDRLRAEHISHMVD